MSSYSPRLQFLTYLLCVSWSASLVTYAQELVLPGDTPAVELGIPERLPRDAIPPPTGENPPNQPTEQPTSRLQNDFPSELLLPPPSRDALGRASRFIESTIEPEIPLNLVVGRPKVLQLARVPKRIYVPDEKVIRTEVIDIDSGREIAITGLAAGSTTLIFWFEDPASPTGQSTVSYLVRVFTDPILARPVESLQRDLNEKFPDSYIELDQIEDRLIVRGQTPDSVEMAQILQVLAGARGVGTGLLRAEPINVPGTSLTVASALNFQETIDPLLAEEAAAARRRIIDPIALAQAGIINQLKVVGEQQVMLKVTVAEVNRSAARSIGLNFSVDDNNGFTVFQSLTGNLVQNAGTTAQTGANILASLDMGQVQLAIEALRRLNLSRTLAEPNLVAMNGQVAEFQAGGRFPVPIISAGGVGNGQNLQGVSFIPFGVQLAFTPIIEDRDMIRLQLNAEVSTRDEALGTTIGGTGNGTQVSGLNSRNFATTVHLRSGQTIAVAGLLQTNYGGSSERVPFWGDLPFIGATGGVNRSSSGEQELVILVTPHLVAPVDAHEQHSLPGDDVFEPTDLEFYVANRLESRRTHDFRASVRTDHARQKKGETCCPEKFMIGHIGPTDRCLPAATSTPHRATLLRSNSGPAAPIVRAHPKEHSQSYIGNGQ